jgi:hypothetical protein
VGIEALEAASERVRALRIVKTTLGVGVAVLIAVVAVTLTNSPPRVVAAGPTPTTSLGSIRNDVENCQSHEALPAGVSAIRISLGAYYGARVKVTVASGSRILTEGTRGPDWTGTSVTVPVTPLDHATSDVTLCVAVGPNSESIFYLGNETSEQDATVALGLGALSGRLTVEYLAAGRGSWWTRILSVARHMGLGHALSGTWVVLLIAALMAAVGLLAVRVTLRELP